MHKECKIYVSILNELHDAKGGDKLEKVDLEDMAGQMYIRRTSRRMENGTYKPGTPFKYKQTV